MTSYGRRSDGPTRPERERRVEHDEVGADAGGHLVDAGHHPRVRQQRRLAHPLDVERLGAIELLGPGVRTGQHGARLRRQPSPPLPQQRLDAADLRREVVRDQQVLHSRPRRCCGPRGVLAQDLVGVVEVGAQHGDGIGVIGRRRRVAQHDEGIAPRPARVTVGEVAAAPPVEHLVVGGAQQGDDVDERRRRLDVQLRPATEPHRRRARVLALVAAVQPVADRLAPVRRDRARLLQQPRQAAPGIDDARLDDRLRRAAVEAPGARAAAVVHHRVRHRQRRRGDHAAEHEPAPRSGHHQVGVLAEPADAGEVGHLAVDDAVVVGERHRLPPVRAQPSGDVPHRLAQAIGDVVPRVPSDPPRDTVGSLGCRRPVRQRPDEDRLSSVDRSLRVRAALGVAVGERHLVGQAGGGTAAQLAPRPQQRRRRGDTAVRDTAGGGDVVQLGDVPGRRRLGAVSPDRRSRPHGAAG